MTDRSPIVSTPEAIVPRTSDRRVVRSRRARRTERSLLALLLAVVTVLFALAFPGSVGANHDVGPERVYVPETGHYLSYGFLDFWHHNGDIPVLGYPITEEFTDPATGLTTQYFERAVMRWHPDAPSGWNVQLARLGAEQTESRQNQFPFQRVSAASDDACTFYQETGHRLCFGFRDYWEDNGGLRIFGYPISEEFSENGLTVQYFERARFEWHPANAGTPYEVLLGHLGRTAAERAGVDTSPLPRSDEVETYDPGLWYVPQPQPQPSGGAAPPPGAPSSQAKWIEIDLTAQYLRAWQYSSVVFGQYVSTGLARYPTPAGTFSIFLKLRYDDMTNGLAAPPGEYYYLEDVPWVMYFAAGGYAIHGTYWHSNFGTPMSHGCVNMTIGGAEWVYNWAPLGTTVFIHY